MINIIDIIALAFLLLFFIISYKRGFVKSIWRIASIAASIAAVILLKKPLVSFLAGTDFALNLETAVSEKIAAAAGSAAEGAGAGMNIPAVVVNRFTNGANAAGGEIARSITMLAINIAAFVLLFVIIRVGLFIAYSFLTGASKLPVLSFANKLAGGITGAAAALITVYIALAFISLFARVDSTLFAMINSSLIVKYFYNYNIILQLIMKL